MTDRTSEPSLIFYETKKLCLDISEYTGKGIPENKIATVVKSLGFPIRKEKGCIVIEVDSGENCEDIACDIQCKLGAMYKAFKKVSRRYPKLLK